MRHFLVPSDATASWLAERLQGMGRYKTLRIGDLVGQGSSRMQSCVEHEGYRVLK